jgi:hypothetical protein
MTSPLKRIESYPEESKRLIGIKHEDFITLVGLVEERHREKQAENEKRQLRLIASGGGRKTEMTPMRPKQGVCLCSDRFRLARDRYSQVIETVCGLVRLHLNASFILSHNI